jgi:hypothetical protein
MQSMRQLWLGVRRIYSFWNYYTKEILYIGLAIDLEERFKQRNGLSPMDPASCKIQQIDQYFQQYEYLGYAIFVQSPLSQPITSRNKATHKKNPQAFEVMDATTERIKEDIRRVEGILIEAYRQNHGILPSWNKVHGSVAGQRSATPGNYDIVKSFSIDTDSLLTAKYTLRELADSATFECTRKHYYMIDKNNFRSM